QEAAQALPFYAQASRLAPNNPEPHHQMGLSLRILGHDSAALVEFHRALALDPTRAITLENIGQTYLFRRDFAQAVRWADSAVALRPDAAFMYLEDAFAHLFIGDTAGARALSLEVSGHGNRYGEQEILAMIEARAGDSASARRRMMAVDSAMNGRDCF